MSGEPPDDDDQGDWWDLSDLQRDGDPQTLDIEEFFVDVSVLAALAAT